MSTADKKDGAVRLSQMEDADDLLPPLSVHMELLAGYLVQLGFVSGNGMGTFKISWQELQAWTELTQSLITSWESGTLLNASQAYAGAISDYSDKSTDAPFVSEDILRSQKVAEEKSYEKMKMKMDKNFGIKNDG